MQDNKKAVHAIWNPEKALEGVFCPKCGVWMDDYYGQPETCPKCGIELEGWVDGRKGDTERDEKSNQI